MRRKSPEVTEAPRMDTSLLKPFASLELPEGQEGSNLLSAVLFASGKLVRVKSDLTVFGLVMAGYEGLSFGDDGRYTARVASQLPLERWDGVDRLSSVVDLAVREVDPPYSAAFTGFIERDEASVYFKALTKQAHGMAVPASELKWNNGSLSL